MSKKVFSLAVNGHLPQLVSLLEEERKNGDDFQLTPATLLPDPARNSPCLSPFVQAAYKGHLDVVQYLAHRYPTLINHTDTVCFQPCSAVHHSTALLAATINGHVKVARALLKVGASTEIEDCTGATPLCEAVFHNHLDLVKLLHEDYGASVNTPNVFGWSPLHVAIDRGHVAVTDYLLERGGASITQTTPEGYTALHVAAMKGRKDVVTKLLQRVGEEKPNSSAVGYVPSPLYLAAANLRHNVVQLLRRRTEISEACWRDVKLLQGVARVEHQMDPLPLWEEALTTTNCATEGTGISSALEVYEWRKEINCREDLTGLEHRHSWTEIQYQALLILERCIGPRDPKLFWQLTKLAETLCHQACDWPPIEKLWLKTLVLYEQNQLCSLERGHLLPQSVEAEVGQWGREHLATGLSAMIRSNRIHAQIDPGFTRYMEFLFKVLISVRRRAEALRKQYGCEEVTPHSLLLAILSLFQVWIVFTTLPCPSQQVREFERMGRRFVSDYLYLSDGSTLLCKAIKRWCDVPTFHYHPSFECDSSEEGKGIPPSNQLLLTALLEWGADEVINVATPPKGNSPVHELCSIVRERYRFQYNVGALNREMPYFSQVARLLPILVSYGAHLDAVNSEGETPHAIYLQAVSPGVIAELCPPVPSPLSCLICHRLLAWCVAYAQLDCLPTRLIQFIRLHDRNKVYICKTDSQ